MSGSIATPLVMAASGPVPTAPATLNAALIAAVSATNPGYTVLPAGLIEDLSSTAVGALITQDQARVDAINSVSPYGANPYVLALMGQQTGIVQGTPSNTSAYVIFGGTGSGVNGSGPGTPGVIIPNNTIVSDGSNQYLTQEAAVIGSSGYTGLVYVVAIASGSFAVPINAISTVVSAIYPGLSFSVYNPAAGVPGGPAESVQSFRSRIIQAGQSTSTGTASFLKSQLQAVPGVQSRLVSIVQTTNGWKIIVGGGDQYAVALAIYQGIMNLATLQGSATTSYNITVSITDEPDSYSIIYVNPPQQVTTVAVTWNTLLTGFTGGIGVAQLGAPAVVNYINSIPVGQPINLLEMNAAFQVAVASLLPSIYLTTLEYTVTVGGTTYTPSAGTSVIPSPIADGYFYCAGTGVTVTQG